MITSLIVVGLVFNMICMGDYVAYAGILGDKIPEHTKLLGVYTQQELLANHIDRFVKISWENIQSVVKITQTMYFCD